MDWLIKPNEIGFDPDFICIVRSCAKKSRCDNYLCILLSCGENA